MTAGTVRAASPRLALVGVFGGLFCGYVGLTAVIPVLPGFVRAAFDASNFAIGFVVTATALTALLMRPVAGALADRYGYRRIMLLGALVIAAGGLLYLLPIGLGALVAIRLLLGVGEASLFTAGAVWTVSLAPHHRRGQLIGLYGVSMWGGTSVGTFLGAAVQRFGYSPVWLFSAGAALVGLALVGSAPTPARQPGAAAAGGEPEQRGGEPGATARQRRGGVRYLLPRPALLPGVALGLGSAGYAGLAAFVVLHLSARGISSGVFVLSTFSAVYAGTRLFIGRWPDQFGPRRVATCSGIGEAVGLLIIAVAPNLPIAVLGSVVMGMGFSLLHPSLALMVMNRTHPAQQGTAIGAYTSFWDLGLAVWGPLVGAVATGLGLPAVFLTGAACAVGAAVVALVVGQPVTRPAAAGLGRTR